MKKSPVIWCAHSLIPSPFSYMVDCALVVEKACKAKESAVSRLPSFFCRIKDVRGDCGRVENKGSSKTVGCCSDN